jgi:hypothetical protein
MRVQVQFLLALRRLPAPGQWQRSQREMVASSESADTFSEHPCDPEFSVIAGMDSRMEVPYDKAAEYLQVRTGPSFEG